MIDYNDERIEMQTERMIDDFIAQCEKNNQTWEEGVSEHLECTVDELRHFLDTSILLQEIPHSTNNND